MKAIRISFRTTRSAARALGRMWLRGTTGNEVCVQYVTPTDQRDFVIVERPKT